MMQTSPFPHNIQYKNSVYVYSLKDANYLHFSPIQVYSHVSFLLASLSFVSFA